MSYSISKRDGRGYLPPRCWFCLDNSAAVGTDAIVATIDPKMEHSAQSFFIPRCDKCMELHNAHLERMDHWYGRGAVIGLIIGIALGPGLRMDEGLFSLLLSVTMILIVFGGGGSAVGLAIVTLVYSLPPFRSRSLHDATSRAREFVARESGRKLVWNFPSYIRWCDPATQSEAPREIDIRAEVAAANLIQFSDLPIDSYFTRRNDQRPLRKLSVDTYIVDQVTYGADRGEWVSLVSDGDRGS